MKAPFIVYEHGDLMFYRTLGDLELALEPIDVSSGEYACYDAEGAVVHLRIERVSRRGFLPGSIEVVRAEPACERRQDELTNHLQQCLRAAGESITEIERLSLAALVEQTVGRLGYSR